MYVLYMIESHQCSRSDLATMIPEEDSRPILYLVPECSSYDNLGLSHTLQHLARWLGPTRRCDAVTVVTAVTAVIWCHESTRLSSETVILNIISVLTYLSTYSL